MTLLSAENLGRGKVWGGFMRNVEIEKAMRLAALLREQKNTAH